LPGDDVVPVEPAAPELPFPALLEGADETVVAAGDAWYALGPEPLEPGPPPPDEPGLDGRGPAPDAFPDGVAPPEPRWAEDPEPEPGKPDPPQPCTELHDPSTGAPTAPPPPAARAR